MSLKCEICGRTYKNADTFLRHKCAREAYKALEQVFDDDDADALLDIAKAADTSPEAFAAAIKRVTPA